MFLFLLYSARYERFPPSERHLVRFDVCLVVNRVRYLHHRIRCFFRTDKVTLSLCVPNHESRSRKLRNVLCRSKLKRRFLRVTAIDIFLLRFAGRVAIVFYGRWEWEYSNRHLRQVLLQDVFW